MNYRLAWLVLLVWFCIFGTKLLYITQQNYSAEILEIDVPWVWIDSSI